MNPQRELFPDFDGSTYVGKFDGNRLSTLYEAVRALMADGRWRTLAEIHRAVRRGSEASISARLRDFRKKKFGGWTVERRRRGAAERGLHEYRVVPGSGAIRPARTRASSASTAEPVAAAATAAATGS